ncbi:NAD(P)-dependent alcohol dehydrogenase [Actinoplanes philippinensis]|uniref:NAD(P)-dependent alcohol dehydrogenase n=1 Tax=Actinoplanes philippinensis TaxID=35752 RepID=UPI0033E1EBDD
MRAVRYDTFGPADVLHVADLPEPRAGRSEVLVRVRAAGVGGGETAIRAGRLRRVMRHRPPAGIGNEFAGHVETVGDGVRHFRAGDAVWGLMPHLTFGSTAELVAVPQKLRALAPANAGLLEAAALPSAGTTVLTALTETVRLRQGQRLLVRGAAGGVGCVAVQLGRALGAHVTALAGARHLDRVRELGAGTAVDYRTAGPGTLDSFDVILDAVGTDLPAYRRLLAPGGRMVALALDPDALVRTFVFIARHRNVVTFSNNPSAERIAELTRLVESGALRPVIDTVFPMDRAADAHRSLEAGGVFGKHVIEVSPERR